MMDDAVIIPTESPGRYAGIAWNPDDPVTTWLEIGQRNLWICHASDPPFDRDSFKRVESIEELKEEILPRSWSLGVAFYIGDLCFINQVNGGDEWLTIKQNVCFESISLKHIIKEPTARNEYETLMADLMAATLEECRKLDYEGAADRRRQEAAECP